MKTRSEQAVEPPEEAATIISTCRLKRMMLISRKKNIPLLHGLGSEYEKLHSKTTAEYCCDGPVTVVP